MLLMLAYAAVSSAWHVPRVLLLSTNEHNSLAAWSLLIAVASLGVAAALAREWQLEGIVASMLLSELAIAVVCAHIAQRLLLTRSFRVANDAV
jgi:ABC-type sugar transport system permease subunit